MEASIVQLRYRMADVLKALERRESITITHRGKVKGIIHPQTGNPSSQAIDHPFFRLRQDEVMSVGETINRLRGGRYNDL